MNKQKIYKLTLKWYCLGDERDSYFEEMLIKPTQLDLDNFVSNAINKKPILKECGKTLHVEEYYKLK